MATLPEYMQRRLARRVSSDITQLAQRQKSNLEKVSQEYQQAFGEYQKSMQEQMAPFEQAMAKYKTQDLPAYESASEAYKEKQQAYKSALEDIQANPYERIAYQVPANVGKGGTSGNAPRGKGGNRPSPAPKTRTVYKQELKEIPEFEGELPELPQAPNMPQLAAFDEEQFKTRVAQLQSEYSREVGERKAARMNVASRRQARPMLQGA